MKKFLGIIVVLILAASVALWAFWLNGGLHNTSPSSNHSTAPQNALVAQDLSHQNLTILPADVYAKTNTQELILSYNSLKSLPTQIGQLINLQILKVDHNLLNGALLAEINKMTQLHQIDASNNLLTGIPAEIGQLPQLTDIDFSNNQIDTMPGEIAKLNSLQNLNLANNRYKSVPGSLLQLKNLKTLDLTGNPIPMANITAARNSLPSTQILF